MDNPVEAIMHDLLIRGMTYLGCQDINYSWLGHVCSWFTKLLYFIDTQPWEDIESVLKSIGDFDQ